MKSVRQSAALEKAQAYRTPDPERRAEASRNLAELNIADAIERALSSAPPLTPTQVKRLSGLLRGAQR
ncbi:hypothetical protein [Clavibacter californiensis]|uniref:Uncharacterized protein n=1 Tax=Clavibacter californiensis TaxID=1401995 RepID=A0ABX9N8F6_9MICO|nr:hypothetical protein [Clavibacter californiensis]RII93282.1 hypothetical protein DZF98_04740 [Clavibacter californiensis]UKF78923.1 hypothetical protein FGD68_08875 [Clavibacter californiensis]